MSTQTWHTPDVALELPDPLEAKFLGMTDEEAAAEWGAARAGDVGTADGWLTWARRNKR